MEPANSVGKQTLLEGIRKDAEHQAESIIDEAYKAAEMRIQSAEKQADSTIREAEKKLVSQKAAINRSGKSQRDQAVKRIRLSASSDIMKEVMRRTEERLRSMITEPGYREVLLSWIVEAGVGLGADSAVVSVSVDEVKLLSEDLIGDAVSRIERITGHPFILTVSTERPLSEQGVILYARDGRKAFNNLVRTRLERFKTEIRSIIYRMIFHEYDSGVRHE